MATTTTRLARLAIELSGLTPDPRSLAALEAAERGDATYDIFASAKAATEDARGRRAENVALAIEAAVGAQVFPGAETFATAAATRVMDAVRLRAHAERDAQVRALAGPWTEAHAETERARLRTLPRRARRCARSRARDPPGLRARRGRAAVARLRARGRGMTEEHQ